MSQKENNQPLRKNYSTFFLLLLLLLIGFGLYQFMQEDGDKIAQTNQPQADKKTVSSAKENLQATDLNTTQQDHSHINSEQTIALNTDAGTFTDTRDGQTYKWVRLKDDKKWMAQNLNYETADTWCYDNDLANCNEYGRLYTWQTANNACPNGWRLPTDGEWWTMASYYGKAYNSYSDKEKMEGPDDGEAAYKVLIKNGDTGFNALLGGSHSSDEGFDYLGDLGSYWSGSENSTGNVWGYYFYVHSKGLARDNYNKALGFSCRCLQD